MSNYLCRKPHLNEIFGAFSGIGHAAMGVALDHPIAVLESKSSDLRYRLRQGVLDRDPRQIPYEYQDKAGGTAIDFLKNSLPLLKEYQTLPLVNAGMQRTGGRLSDVILHIYSLIDREATGTERALIQSSMAGDLTPKFAAAYLPKPYTGSPAEELQDIPEPVKADIRDMEFPLQAMTVKRRKDETIPVPSVDRVEPALHA